MRVLFWSPAFWPEIGGVQVFGAQLPALRARGYGFCVVTQQYSPNLAALDSFRGIPVYRFPFSAALSAGKIDDVIEIRKQVIELKQAFAPDLVHMNSVDVGTFFHQTTAYSQAAPLLITLHGLWPNQDSGKQSLLQQTLQSADWTTCCSTALLDRARQIAPEIRHRSSVIPNAMRPSRFVPESVPLRAPMLLCLGRLVLVKGFDVALTAFAAIAPRFPKARLVLAGDGPERQELQNQVAKLGLSDRVEFLGWVAPDEVPALIKSATLVVVPSRCEGFGLVALEAALMARPVIATCVGGLPEVVKDNETGLIVPGEDDEALAGGLLHLLTHPETAVEMGRRARRRALKRFNWQHHVDAYDTLYRRLIREACTKRREPETESA